MLFEEVGFEDQAVAFVMIYIDPVVLIYYLIAIGIFIFASYNKPELRIFPITFGCIVLSVIMMMSHAHEAEAFFIFLAGIFSIISIFYYRSKTKVKIMEVNKSG